MEKQELIPYKDMVKQSITVGEAEPIQLSNGYQLKVRVKRFVLQDRRGVEYTRGPCVSLQLFHNGHFIKGLALEQGIEEQLIDRLQKVGRFLT